MSSVSNDIFVGALALPQSERVALAKALLDSLSDKSPSELDAIWAQEANNRLKAYRHGELLAIPADEVFRSLSRQG